MRFYYLPLDIRNGTMGSDQTLKKWISPNSIKQWYTTYYRKVWREQLES